MQDFFIGVLSTEASFFDACNESVHVYSENESLVDGSDEASPCTIVFFSGVYGSKKTHFRSRLYL